MQHAKIVRTQHSVGHGGFHTGSITTTEISAPHTMSAFDRPTGVFHYVYDCGSEQSEAFNAELSLFREQSGGATGILFVSHLHADHINGIDRLQAMAPARKAVVPYLDDIERLLFVLSDFERGQRRARLLTISEIPSPGGSIAAWSRSSFCSRADQTTHPRPVQQIPTCRPTIRESGAARSTWRIGIKGSAPPVD